MALSIDQFLNEVAASGFVSAADLLAWLSAIPDSGRPKTGEELARELVQQKKLTQFQAEQIYAGQGKSLTLGNYLILDKLGQGGMGLVLKAMHRRMERIVALKVMSQAGMRSPDAVQRFHREVKAAAKLNHPNIVTAHDADESNGTHFLVMEYVEGVNLSALVKERGPLPAEQAVQCILQAARGLEYAHSRGVIHRDIKPSNLLLSRETRDERREGGETPASHPSSLVSHPLLKILDMGLARIDGGASAQAELTTTGAVMGTVDYMAPEQALSAKSADARSDIYSLGITLWYLLTGRVAYDGDSLMAKLLAHRDAVIPSLAEELRRVGQPSGSPPSNGASGAGSQTASSGGPRGLEPANQAVDAIFRKMVAKQAKDRYQSMTEVIRDLERCLSGMPPSDTAPLFIGTEISQAAAEAETVMLSGVDRGTDPRTDRSMTLEGTSLHRQTSAVRQSKSRFVLVMSIATAILVPLAIVFSQKDQSAQRPGQNESSTATETASNSKPGEDNSHTNDSKRIQSGVAKSSDPAPPNYALLFSKYSHRVELPAFKLKPDETHTVEAFVTPANEQVPGTTWGHFICLKDQLTLQMHDENVSSFYARFIHPSGELRHFNAGAAKLLKGRRAHVAGVQATGDVRFFVDGKLVSVIRTEGKMLEETMHPGFIGGGTGSMGFFDGIIDEVRISNTARYDRDFIPETRFNNDEKTLALYHCDEGTGIELIDSSGNNRHGMLLGATWVRIDESSSATSTVRSPTTTRKPPLAKAPFDETAARAHQQAWASDLGTTVETTNSFGAKMILIPPGEFLMGSTDDQIAAAAKEAEEIMAGQTVIDRIQKSERPQHRVVITKPFLMGATEVTLGQFKKFIAATERQTTGEKQATDASSRTYLRPGYPVTDDSPVSVVTWDEATAYCNWLSDREQAVYRLPTEAEWEYACRAGTETLWSWGDGRTHSIRYAWTIKNSELRSHPVATKLPNPFGLFDLHGNVSEWCQDHFDETWYSRSPSEDPLGSGPNAHTLSVRGGSWDYNSIERSAYRTGFTHHICDYTIGFRVVREIEFSREQVFPDRHAAEWVIAQGGRVRLKDRSGEIASVAELPQSDFKVLQVNLNKQKLSGRHADLVPLRGLQQVVFIGLDASNVSAEGLAGLASIPSLERISVGGGASPLGDDRVAAITKIKTVQKVYLVNARLTPAQCAVLAANMPQAIAFDFTENSLLNDAAIEPLGKLSKLESLQLNRTQVTASGVAALQKALPNCKIQWDGTGQ